MSKVQQLLKVESAKSGSKVQNYSLPINIIGQFPVFTNPFFIKNQASRLIHNVDDGVNPVNPVKPVNPVNPVNPVKPVKPVNPANPENPGQNPDY